MRLLSPKLAPAFPCHQGLTILGMIGSSRAIIIAMPSMARLPRMV
ncbi:hypothetical protein SAMN06296065_11637 [Novosphingobium panipatense]|uniref:Uncharacterized protein n=1 Tax=Novosphingobium panipatense TaxID=428991 RepID=A0ABY1QWJ1_9SPHN|nr:hypothetical protein SAMN06296065_11637 [Novosphingobium panipatense]